MNSVKVIVGAATAAAVFGLGISSAFGSNAEATAAVNVRTAPGVGNAKVDVLYNGESVDIKECRSGWCYVEHSGPDGWVSDNYLRRVNGTGGYGNSGNSGATNDSAGYPVAARATATVNVRSAPGIGHSKVDVLRAGENVTINQCRGSWCYINHNGPDGWVSSRYLARGTGGGGNGGSSGNDGDPNVSFSFGIGPDGPNFDISVGDQPPRQRRSQACFFADNNFSGNSFCVDAGSRMARVPHGWNDRISSVKLIGDASSVTMCKDINFKGFCRTTHRDERALGRFLNDEISSIRVR